MSKYKDALKNLIEAKESNKKDTDIYYYLGLSYMAIKDYFNAIENFNSQINISKKLLFSLLFVIIN